MMKSRMFALASALVAMAIAGCADASSPVSPTSSLQNNPTTGGVIGSQQKINEDLDRLDPELRTSIQGDGAYELSMVVGAGGMPGSPDLEALREINVVEFRLLSGNDPIDFRRTDDIVSSGIARTDGFTSLTTTATVRWLPPFDVAAASSAVMTIYTDDGVVVRSSPLPSKH